MHCKHHSNHLQFLFVSNAKGLQIQPLAGSKLQVAAASMQPLVHRRTLPLCVCVSVLVTTGFVAFNASVVGFAAVAGTVSQPPSDSCRYIPACQAVVNVAFITLGFVEAVAPLPAY